MLRRNRVYRVLRTTVTIVAAAFRYFWLTRRAKWKRWQPSAEAWDRAHQKTGRSIYRLATSLGGAYVKLGQVLGGRGDFFPSAFTEPLKSLHDRVPPRPLSELREHIEGELGRPIEDVFRSIDDEPLAAASLAQVHRAELSDGEVVAVKVQYPEAERLFPVDLGSLRRAVRVARWLNRKLDLRPLVDELARFVVLEIDFRREARSTTRVREAICASSTKPAQVAGIVVPRVHESISSAKLLVLEFVQGVPLTSEEALDKHKIDREGVAMKIAELYVAMIFDHGFFHGDPHPGNFLVQADGTVAMLDFGLAKELPEGFATGVGLMITSAMAGNGEAALSAAEDIGFVFAKRDPAPLLSTMRMILGDYSDPDRLAPLLKSKIIETVPAEFALIVRAFVLLNGLSHRLAPGKRLIMVTLAARLFSQAAAAKTA